MGPLEGLRVVDFSRLAPGPYCTMLLADMGAEVVRVDRARATPSYEALVGDPLGRGKRSVALDLRREGGLAAALRLVDEADVLVEGFRPGVMERLGIGPDVALERNPRLVYARVTGWGQEGPLRDRAGHDIDYIAVAGVLGMIGRAGQPPLPPLNLLGDFAGGGAFAALGILAALIERGRSGRGQVVDAAMVDGAASLAAFLFPGFRSGLWGPRGTNLLDTGAPFYEVYETADGGYMAVGALEPEFYAELIDGLGLPAAELPPQMDRESWPTMKERFADAFRSRTRDEWTTLFQDRDACVFPVLDPVEAPGHPFNAARGTYEPDGEGSYRPGPAPRQSRTPARAGGRPPDPGEHTREILSEAGFSSGEIEALLAGGAAEEHDRS